MQNNIKPAVRIIAVLSLLLGLSIGQHYRQYQHIKALENRTPHFSPIQVHLNRNHCNINFTSAQVAIEVQRAEIESIKEQMRMERELQLKELHEQIEKVKQMGQRGR